MISRNQSETLGRLRVSYNMKKIICQSEIIRVWRVAEILDCSRGFVYGLIRRKELEAIRLGVRGLRVEKKSLEEYLTKSNIKSEQN